MSKISILTPTIRPQGLDLTVKSLQRQTLESWEWIICAPKILEKEIEQIIANRIPYIFLGNVPLKKGQFWDLNYSYNRLFKEAHFPLCVSLQDWIYVPPDGLQKFWDSYEETNKQALISGVGDQYQEIDSMGKPTIKIWADPRKTTKYGTFYECYFQDCEWNWSAVSKNKFLEAGGMDEGLDFLGYGGDQMQVCNRIDDGKIAKFYIDQGNESFTIRHDRSAHGGQTNWDKNHVMFNGMYKARKDQLIKENNWPVLKDFGRGIDVSELVLLENKKEEI